ncbi:MAG: hypothetical protein HY738_07275 [Bacteroidia bacterium]|nr:hypothetical protein [Bacteroidia bacterium]
MKNKELILFPAVFLVLSGTIILHRQLKPTRTGFTVNAAPDEIGCPENIQNRAEWEFERLKDPVTNSIPADIRRKELEFAKKLPYFNSTLKNNTWVARGPYNVGGRTRGAAIDVTNENIIIAGGVSGGLWRTVDGGNSWQKVIKPFQLHNVTCLVQDTRPGKTNIWYYGTGEVDGNSANESFSAPFRGDGIFKSTDNGLNWDSLPSTYSGTPYHTDPWDFIWNISLDYSNDSTDIVYVALSKSIRKSMDGGLTWSNIIPFTNNGPIYTDVAVTSTGVVYIAMSIRWN